MIARTVGLFAEMQILAVKDFARWWNLHRPNVALNDDEWQAEFEKYLRQGMTAPKQKMQPSMGSVTLMAMNHPLYKRAVNKMAWDVLNSVISHF